jgi:hypothetical protein
MRTPVATPVGSGGQYGRSGDRHVRQNSSCAGIG